jgi:hypothetical protein
MFVHSFEEKKVKKVKKKKKTNTYAILLLCKISDLLQRVLHGQHFLLQLIAARFLLHGKKKKLKVTPRLLDQFKLFSRPYDGRSHYKEARERPALAQLQSVSAKSRIFFLIFLDFFLP